MNLDSTLRKDRSEERNLQQKLINFNIKENSQELNQNETKETLILTENDFNNIPEKDDFEIID